jgi:8-oxo-dGTP pyrophosphatase MutT (NUDIX family)
MKRRFVRPIAICVLRDGDRILVSEGHDSVKRQTFYRPLGGTIEFGERGEETVKREFLEEIQAELEKVRYLGALENIFTLEGQAEHEIVLVYKGEFVDKSLHTKDLVEGIEDGKGLRAVWLPIEPFRIGDSPLYPDGLLELLESG